MQPGGEMRRRSIRLNSPIIEEQEYAPYRHRRLLPTIPTFAPRRSPLKDRRLLPREQSSNVAEEKDINRVRRRLPKTPKEPQRVITTAPISAKEADRRRSVIGAAKIQSPTIEASPEVTAPGSCQFAVTNASGGEPRSEGRSVIEAAKIQSPTIEASPEVTSPGSCLFAVTNASGGEPRSEGRSVIEAAKIQSPTIEASPEVTSPGSCLFAVTNASGGEPRSEIKIVPSIVDDATTSARNGLSSSDVGPITDQPRRSNWFLPVISQPKKYFSTILQREKKLTVTGPAVSPDCPDQGKGLVNEELTPLTETPPPTPEAPPVKNNPITEHFLVGKIICNAGHRMIWRVYSACRKTDNLEASVFVLDKTCVAREKCTGGGTSMLERIRYGLDLLKENPSHGLLPIIHGPEEGEDTITFATEAIYGTMKGAFAWNEPVVINRTRPHYSTLKTTTRLHRPSYAVKTEFSPLQIRFGILQMFSALDGLHNNRGLIHRNICAENILISQRGTLKLFGLEFAEPRPIGDRESLVSSNIWARKTSYIKDQNLDYVAPEIVTCAKFGASSDIYSLGVIILRIYNLEKPLLRTKNLPKRYKEQLKQMDRRLMELTSNVPEDLRSTVQSMVSVNWKKRPLSRALLASDGFRRENDEGVVDALQQLDLLLVQPAESRATFYKETLLELLPNIPREVGWTLVLPVLRVELQMSQILESVLPAFFWMARESHPDEFQQYVVPVISPMLGDIEAEPRTYFKQRGCPCFTELPEQGPWQIIAENLAMLIKQCDGLNMSDNIMLSYMFRGLFNKNYEKRCAAYDALEHQVECMERKVLQNEVLPRLCKTLQCTSTDEFVLRLKRIVVKVSSRLEQTQIEGDDTPVLDSIVNTPSSCKMDSHSDEFYTAKDIEMPSMNKDKPSHIENNKMFSGEATRPIESEKMTINKVAAMLFSRVTQSWSQPTRDDLEEIDFVIPVNKEKGVNSAGTINKDYYLVGGAGPFKTLSEMTAQQTPKTGAGDSPTTSHESVHWLFSTLSSGESFVRRTSMSVCSFFRRYSDNTTTTPVAPPSVSSSGVATTTVDVTSGDGQTPRRQSIILPRDQPVSGATLSAPTGFDKVGTSDSGLTASQRSATRGGSEASGQTSSFVTMQRRRRSYTTRRILGPSTLRALRSANRATSRVVRDLRLSMGDVLGQANTALDQATSSLQRGLQLAQLPRL